MRLKKAYLLLLPFLCIFLFGCAVQDYPTYTYQIVNGLGEDYLVNYCEQTNYPENNTRVKVFRGKKKVIDYNGGSYSGCNSYTPSQIVFICKSGDVDYYYMKSQLAEYLVADGMVDLKTNYNMLLLNKNKGEMTDDERKVYSRTSAAVRSAISAENVEKRFADCGYSSASFMLFYNYT
ncbi:hypothetical protein [Ruminococcus flavefaciens]|uniref:hypothetical protein n=1 Tax=Ruminococcus flavefaciens TaxID=1265 RepID=UPI0012BBF046|nr:hypothetical protein [Ruminococcus flavefaciens]